MMLSFFLLATICAGLFGISNWILVGKTLTTWAVLGLMFALGWAACWMITHTAVLKPRDTDTHEPNISRPEPVSRIPYKDVPKFVADRKALRTFDHETGFELIHDGGGSDGSMRFKIIGPTSSCAFGAHMAEDRKSDGELIHWIWEVYNWRKEWEPVIYAALRAYKSVHGHTSSKHRYFVRFGTKGALLSA